MVHTAAKSQKRLKRLSTAQHMRYNFSGTDEILTYFYLTNIVHVFIHLFVWVPFQFSNRTEYFLELSLLPSHRSSGHSADCWPSTAGIWLPITALLTLSSTMTAKEMPVLSHARPHTSCEDWHLPCPHQQRGSNTQRKKSVTLSSVSWQVEWALYYLQWNNSPQSEMDSVPWEHR